MKRIDPRAVGALALLVSLAACVAPPTGPTIPVAPGPGKSFDAFAADQHVCSQFAYNQPRRERPPPTTRRSAPRSSARRWAPGLGAAIGGGRGAAIGAASGAGLGTVVGASNSAYAQMSLQQQYDVMFGECMAAHGNQVPGFAPPPGAPTYSRAMGRRPPLRPAAPGLRPAASA